MKRTKVLKSVVRLVMIYCNETWPMKKAKCGRDAHAELEDGKNKMNAKRRRIEEVAVVVDTSKKFQ